MTRKRYIKLLMSIGYNKRWATIIANDIVEDNHSMARINHEWKLKGFESRFRQKPVAYKDCLPTEFSDEQPDWDALSDTIEGIKKIFEEL